MEGGQHGIFIFNFRPDRAEELFLQGQVHHGAGVHHELHRDVLLQAGSVVTGWVGHPCEMKWTLDG